ncbi:hypothetical protein [uncultured Microscilla sp.]|uniref:hypothetical protein n=1 Tax=uncultured Microscilla sp. TaxID=432653 RepID=UPI0026211060|nr:hypothetical protein [uncultured Microscilla sp.]
MKLNNGHINLRGGDLTVEKGKARIGTTEMPEYIGGKDISDYRLFVAGGILTEAVRVRTDWADYVFEPSYKLAPLSEVEKYIAEKGHLPNVPSAKEVASEGIDVGEISKIQQEKIEEVFLHLIKMNKAMQKMQQKIQTLEDENKTLKTQLNNK